MPYMKITRLNLEKITRPNLEADSVRSRVSQPSTGNCMPCPAAWAIELNQNQRKLG